MKVTIKYGDSSKVFENKSTIVIGSVAGSDFVVGDLPAGLSLKLMYMPKFNNYILVNGSNDRDVFFNGKVFSKVLVTPHFTVTTSKSSVPIDISVEMVAAATIGAAVHPKLADSKPQVATANTIHHVSNNSDDLFDNDVEKHRIAIIKEIGFRILELKGNIRSANITNFILNVAIFILSVVSSFGITNFLLGFKIDNSSSVLNLTTNVGFLICVTVIVGAVCLIMKQGIYSLCEFNQTKRFGDSDIAQKFIIGIASFFLFIVYVMNLFYYKSIPGFLAASLFISLLFVGALATVTVASGYFKFQIKNYKQQLTNCEYREDFEAVMKSYRALIHSYINKLSQNRINAVKGSLVNHQLKMVVEVFIGLLTSPFLAYGVSNTLAGCFPEAANWVRISGLRFSPIFLVLATFLIIFAFFSFVRAFTIGKQIKGSEIIKFDGFHDYSSHGVTVLGMDSMRSLEREKNIVMYIACFIILIEFTMNVSYFITEIGGDIQGMFLSFVTALVPTALLIAETHLLSSTMYKINNFSELLDTLD